MAVKPENVSNFNVKFEETQKLNFAYYDIDKYCGTFQEMKIYYKIDKN